MTSKPKNKIPLILFTGGVDSTYLLYNRLLQSEIDILYVSGCVDSLKEKAELKSRNKILKYINENFTNSFNVRNSFVYQFNIPKDIPVWSSFLFQQLPVWLFAALLYSNEEIHSSVEIAYIMSDEIMIHRSSIIKAWNFLNEISKTNPLPLEFPLWLNRKTEIIKSLGELYYLTWSCETPILKNDIILKCEKCPACKRKQWEEYNLDISK